MVGQSFRQHLSPFKHFYIASRFGSNKTLKPFKMLIQPSENCMVNLLMQMLLLPQQCNGGLLVLYVIDCTCLTICNQAIEKKIKAR
jgi:hypothetical protein